ncbi:MAG TPA: AbrB/MazE/SpoVT family DNA-binding domain-containing protein [Rhizorhapis sp.]|nr:AbrB/MazE/SpoVT family DNA-binding domain-containing protein [Rhizorhapis sp.]
MYRECRYIGAVMRVQVKKWGNSASVRIPASIMAAASLHIDQEVDVREEEGRVIIEPIAAPVFTLEGLLAGMKPETFPENVDFGGPVGKEIW